MKKLCDAPAKINSQRTKNVRCDFGQWLLQNGVQREELLFIDEAGINLYVVRTRGRARVGERAVRVVNGRRGPNLTLCFACGIFGSRLRNGCAQQRINLRQRTGT